MSTSTDTQPWTENSVADQTGRVAVVTGANSGIGFHTARVLAAKGAAVVMACRNLDKAQKRVDDIAASTPTAKVSLVALDLSSLRSVREAASQLRSEHARLDLIINNAGVMWTPPGLTDDGFETQFGTNHLGHFAFTGLLLDLLLPVEGSRVVTVSSMGHYTGRLDLADLQSRRHYGRHSAYAKSKLANLMFTYELQRRLGEAKAATIAVAAHPGLTKTDLSRNSPGLIRTLDNHFGHFISQSPAMGALPTLRAATDPEAEGGEYFGPGKRFEMAGPPRRVSSSRRSHDVTVQRALWAESERLTEIKFPV